MVVQIWFICCPRFDFLRKGLFLLFGCGLLVVLVWTSSFDSTFMTLGSVVERSDWKSERLGSGSECVFNFNLYLHSNFEL